MENKEFISTTGLAKVLGVSRIAVYKQIKSGKIKAEKRGRNFVIRRNDFAPARERAITPDEKAEIVAAVKKTVAGYGDTLRFLSQS